MTEVHDDLFQPRDVGHLRDQVRAQLQNLLDAPSDREWDIIAFTLTMNAIAAVAAALGAPNELDAETTTWIQSSATPLLEGDTRALAARCLRRLRQSEYLEEIMWPDERGRELWLPMFDNLAAWIGPAPQ